MVEQKLHGEQVSLGAKVTKDPTILGQKGVIFPPKKDEVKHQTPPQIIRGTWESSYEN
jgi:hypothetical protein